MKKRIAAFLLVAVLLISAVALVACNAKTDNTPKRGTIVLKFYTDDEASGNVNLYDEPYFLSEYREGEDIKLPAEPTKDGWVFDGWYMDTQTAHSNDGKLTKENLQVFADQAKDGISSVITVYAHWRKA